MDCTGNPDQSIIIKNGEGHKPNSVYAAIYLGPLLPDGSLRPTRSLGRAVLDGCLLGLAPGGVCHAARITAGAVSSYLAISPLPFRAVSFLLHFPSPRGARALPGTLPCGVRTFLAARFTAGQRCCLSLSISINNDTLILWQVLFLFSCQATSPVRRTI